MISGGYSTFIAPATGAIYSFIKLENGVLSTIRHPFRNTRSTIKLILYLFLFVLLLCKLTGRDCNTDLAGVKQSLLDVFGKLKDKGHRSREFITDKLTTIRPIILSAFATMLAGGASTFEKVKEMFSTTKTVVNEVDEADMKEKEDLIKELEQNLRDVLTRGADESELLALEAQIAGLKADLEHLRAENERLLALQAEMALAEAQARGASESEISGLMSKLNEAERKLSEAESKLATMEAVATEAARLAAEMARAKAEEEAAAAKMAEVIEETITPPLTLKPSEQQDKLALTKNIELIREGILQDRNKDEAKFKRVSGEISGYNEELLTIPLLSLDLNGLVRLQDNLDKFVLDYEIKMGKSRVVLIMRPFLSLLSLHETVTLVSRDSNKSTTVTFNGENYSNFNNVFNVPTSTGLIDRILPLQASTSKDIYQNSRLDTMVNNVVNSELDLIMLSYGPSGSGKTYNMLGDGSNEGIIHKVVQDLINMKESSVQDISVQGVQVYMNNLYRVKPLKGHKDILQYKISTKEYPVNNIPSIENPMETFSVIENIKRDKAFIEGIKVFLDNIVVYTDNKSKNDQAKTYVKTSLLYFLGKNAVSDKFSVTDVNFLKKKDTFRTREELLEIKQFLINSVKNLKVSMTEFDSVWLEENRIDDMKNVDAISIGNLGDLKDFLHVSKMNRLTRSTINNPDSSRSHLFLLFTITKNNNTKVKILVSDLAGSEDPFEYCGIAAVEGFYVINSLYQIKQVISSSSVSSISDLPTRNGILPAKVVLRNFNKNTSTFTEPIVYNNDGSGDSKFAINTVFKSIITNKTISYTFLNIKGYKDESVGLEKDIGATLRMAKELKESRSFGSRTHLRRRTSKPRKAKAYKRKKSLKQRSLKRRT